MGATVGVLYCVVFQYTGVPVHIRTRIDKRILEVSTNVSNAQLIG